KGRISTGGNELVASNTSSSAITGHGLNKYVIGNLRRYVAASGSYDFPVGNTSYYDLGNISFNGQSGITSLLGYFTTGQSGTAPSTSTCQINGSKINDYLNNGFWTFTPNSTMSGGTYDVTLNAMGYSNAPTAANQMGVIKRSDASSPWLGCGLLNGSAQSSAYGSHSNATQSISGGVATAVRSGVTGFSDFAIGLHQTNTPLPVTLMYLTATEQDDRYIALEWATASEINNSGFQVERSTDGIAFEPIAWVDGSGNSNSMIKYGTDDRQVATGIIYYYRLKQVDYDGKYEYSNIVSASLAGGNNGISIHNIYPNPAAAQVTVDIVAAEETPVAISFTDVLGREVLGTQWQLHAGYNDRRFDIAALADGVYHVTVKTGNSFFTKVLTIAK
ncbi:MAG: T9SS type A sorting domain-containing protein, partial [Bacteroidetes bacterium]|nr:T9SS type A sorting domain-containing protein [Bacteroidota bacterium]